MLKTSFKTFWYLQIFPEFWNQMRFFWVHKFLYVFQNFDNQVHNTFLTEICNFLKNYTNYCSVNFSISSFTKLARRKAIFEHSRIFTFLNAEMANFLTISTKFWIFLIFEKVTPQWTTVTRDIFQIWKFGLPPTTKSSENCN